MNIDKLKGFLAGNVVAIIGLLLVGNSFWLASLPPYESTWSIIHYNMMALSVAGGFVGTVVFFYSFEIAETIIGDEE